MQWHSKNKISSGGGDVFLKFSLCAKKLKISWQFLSINPACYATACARATYIRSDTHKGENMFQLIYKISSEDFGSSTPNPPLQHYWLCHTATICPFKLCHTVILCQKSQNVALKCHKVAKFYMLQCGRKIVTTCSQNLLNVTFMTKMWHRHSLLWLVHFFVTNGK